jgi:hypothetical protein
MIGGVFGEVSRDIAQLFLHLACAANAHIRSVCSAFRPCATPLPKLYIFPKNSKMALLAPIIVATEDRADDIGGETYKYQKPKHTSLL